MKDRKITSVCLIILTTLFLLTGCINEHTQTVPSHSQTIAEPVDKSTVQPNQTNQPSQTPAKQTVPPSNSETQSSGSPLDKACSQMEVDFASAMGKITQGDTDKMNFVIASDRLNGLQAFNCHGQNFSSIIGADRDLIRKNLQGSLVYSGYTTDGLHFLALVQSTKTADQIYKAVMATLRNDDQEFQLLYDLLFKLGYRSMDVDGAYFAIDLYAEDLSGKREQIPVDSITVSTLVDGGTFQQTNPIIPENKKLDQLLKQYNRTLGDPHDIRNKSWNLFLFSAGSIIKDGDDHPFIIEVAGKRIYMRNMWL